MYNLGRDSWGLIGTTVTLPNCACAWEDELQLVGDTEYSGALFTVDKSKIRIY